MSDKRKGAAIAIGRTSPAVRTAALLILLPLLAGAAHAAGGPPGSTAAADAKEAAEEAQDQILVTGHRQRGAVATDIAPEVSLNSTAIRALGAADLDEVFQELAPEIGSGAPGRSPATAEGGPIVLVNGQRIAGFSSIRDFPPEAVRRIEIFPAEVALQYGYGPDRRVVNIVLRSQYRALTLLGRYTAAPDDWRGVYRGKIDLLRIGENSHSNLDIDFRHVDPIFDENPPALPAGVTDPAAVPRHTLAAQDDHLTISGTTTQTLGKVSAELSAGLDLDALQSRPGLSDEDAALLASEGLSNLVSGPVGRLDRTAAVRAGLTLNGRLGGWRWSFIGNLDDSTRVTRTTDTSGVGGWDTILLPSPGLIGTRCGTVIHEGCVVTETRHAGGDLYLNGALFALPAGPVTAALRTGLAFSGIRSDSPLSGSAQRDRSEGTVQANIDVPLTRQAGPLGKITAGAHGELHPISDFGTLSTFGPTLRWSPVKPVELLATFSREEQAPSLLQLGQAALETPDLREYDFVTDTTTLVQRIEGGNGDLRRQTSRIATLRLQVTPLRDLTLSAEYRLEHSRNAIVSLTAATAETMAAFPDHFTRENGYLTAIDVSPVNIARREQQQIRWGLTWSTPFGPARTEVRSPAKPPVRDQFQIALFDTWRLEDEAVLRDGQRRLDLLDGDFISDTGGTPRHQIELQTSLSTPGWSVDVNAQWQAPTNTNAGELAQDRLTFSQGIRLNLRMTINLADQPWLSRRLPFLRGNLNLSADNLLGAHIRVHDAGGNVPAAYRESYVNPVGRTFRITLRKRFR